MGHTRACRPMCDNRWDAWTWRFTHPEWRVDACGFGGSAVCLFGGLSEARTHPGHDLDCSLMLFFLHSPSWGVTVLVPCDLTLMVMAYYTVGDQKIWSLARMIEPVFLRIRSHTETIVRCW